MPKERTFGPGPTNQGAGRVKVNEFTRDFAVSSQNILNPPVVQNNTILGVRHVKNAG